MDALRRITNDVARMANGKSRLNVSNRAEFHDILQSTFHTYTQSDSVYVTHFEDARTPFKSPGYFVERDFMTEWFNAIEQRQFAVDVTPAF